MRKNTTFPKDVEDQLLEYRKSRKSDTGMLLFRETAIVELLRAALTDFQPPAPDEDDYMDNVDIILDREHVEYLVYAFTEALKLGSHTQFKVECLKKMDNSEQVLTIAPTCSIHAFTEGMKAE